ncbi:hypothetical protein [Streptomyces sp. MP131-18]|uniref:hypothetical protein n=1 Tax=Streptomyces sp. MP131-18 TaxID=1857892 RepID=UPI00097BD30C|nr:hypothetical protein [Streptomyces sp. MP131-18]ONK09474.1 hypothetical protein STBA_01740 [Streptomyces sp. MP131-18]
MAFGRSHATDALSSIGTAISALGESVRKGAADVTAAITKAHTDLNTKIDAIGARLHIIQTNTLTSSDGETIRREITNLRTEVATWKAEAAAVRAEAEVTRRALEAATQPATPAGENPSALPPDGSPPREHPTTANTPSSEPSRPDADRNDVGEYHDLLLIAGRVSSAKIVVHRDLWAFLIEHAAAEQHFRVPGDVKELDEGRVEVALSGRSLIAAITAVWELRRRRSRDQLVGDWALANTLYQSLRLGIHDASRSDQGPGAKRITIDIDLQQGGALPVPDSNPPEGDQP